MNLLVLNYFLFRDNLLEWDIDWQHIDLELWEILLQCVDS